MRANYGVNPEAIRTNVEYNLRELRALYLPTDRGAAEELCRTPGADGPGGNALYQELRRKHARAAGIDYPDVTAEQLRGAMYDWHVFPNTVFLVDMGCCLDLPGPAQRPGPGLVRLRRAGAGAAAGRRPAHGGAGAVRGLA